MMKLIRLITSIITIFLLHSCMKGIGFQDNVYSLYGIIQGTVTDDGGRPLEKIRITINTDEADNPLTVYTSSDGTFICEFPLFIERGQIRLDIRIDDIDGEENGGFFESKTGSVTIFEEDYQEVPVIIDLPPYRLSHAIASESNLQS